jgi:hypothetical protein
MRLDSIELRALVDAYALAMDDCDPELLGGLFVPDGELVVLEPGRIRPLARLTGTGVTGIAAIPLAMQDAYVSTLHHVTTHHARVEGMSATGATSCIAQHVPADGGDIEVLAVRYRDQFIREDDGWRFRRREVTRLWASRIPARPGPLGVDHAVAARLAEGRD